ncbi:MAG: YdiU family protein [Proteobacteria bacterium]|nr:YdiU family protein [Pseudomonadota bacterium]
MHTISELDLRTDFVDALPGDASQVPGSRQVFEACWSSVQPTPVAGPQLLVVVPEVAELLGLDPAPTDELAAVLGGNQVVDGMKPFAACYGGHQFGHWAGQLGDGRAMTLGQVHHDGQSFELQLKGAGPTPYSRRADGRAVLRSSLRELICSEAMHHLGVPTTRALALTWTGDGVLRDMLYDGHPEHEPGAIATRVAPSFLRFGSFEIHAARGDRETLRTLVDYTIDRHFPELEKGDVVGLFREVSRRTALLMVDWMRVGFVHGVMNTDNLSVLGLTMDYGPYGWLEPYDLDWTPNTTDAQGKRYRYGWQPSVARWNLSRFGGALSALVEDTAPLDKVLVDYADIYDEAYVAMMLQKLGVESTDAEGDHALIEGLSALLTSTETDMTLFFRRLADVPAGAPASEAASILAEALYEDVEDYATLLGDWYAVYSVRVAASSQSDAKRRASMNAVNPLYVPRNYLAQLAIDATEPGKTEALEELLDVLRKPYTAQPGREKYAEKRPEWARNRPGCSMLSCSS